MEKVYTEIRGTFVFPDSADLDSLKPDSCLVGKQHGKLSVTPLSALKGREVEAQNRREDYHPLWGWLGDKDKEKPFILMGGVKRKPKFCDFCKERLNGITGNCFNSSVKPNGCSFDPVAELDPFRISLDGWRKIRAVDTNPHSAFTTPGEGEADFNPETAERNRKIRIVSRHLEEYQLRKVEKYCSRCIYQGTCDLDSRKVTEHCMVTEEETREECLKEIRKRFGSVATYLRLLAYGGGRLEYKPRRFATESEWIISHPLSKKRFQIVQFSRYFEQAKIPRDFVEAKVTPKPLPSRDGEKIAALAWYYLNRYRHNRLWVSPKEGGIEVTHQTGGSYYFFRRQTFTSFSEILYFHLS